MIKRLLPLLCLAVASLPLQALELPRESAVPGGVAIVPIQAGASAAPRVHYRGHRVMVVESAGTDYASRSPWLAVVGLPLSAKPGAQTLEVDGKATQFEIKDKAYREQRITLENKRQVNPTPLDMERINREKREILGALASWTPMAPVVTQLAKPAEGPYSSPFGLKRFFNDQPRNPHSGLDIAAPKGSPILAPAPGRVVATGDYFFNGNTVILDHGNGLTTMYCHMDRIDVKVGERLDAGMPLGTVGNTGRATGPHLHWGVSLNNQRVNPSLFLTDLD